MAKDELIDSRVSLKQCKLAVEALHIHESQKERKLQETELLPGKEPNIWLNVTVKKIPPGHKFKPIKIPITHPLVDPRTTSICLITKDPQREYKDLLEAQNIKFISRVVGIQKLKGKFKPFEARRMLLKENGLFLADERIVPLLPKLLGVKWFEAKKQPIPVSLKRKDLKGELERAISSTYMNQNKGTCTSIKVGNLSQKPAQILANIKTALPAIAENTYGGWDNIQAFHIKTNSSVSLPIWSCSLDESEGGRWNGLTAETEDEDGSDEDSGSDDIKVDVAEAKTTQKGKKRVQEDDELDMPKKKSKDVEGKARTEPTTKKDTTSATTSTPTADVPQKTKKRKSLGSEATPSVITTHPEPTSIGKKVRKSTSTTETVTGTPEKTTPSTLETLSKKKNPKKVEVAQAAPSVVPITKDANRKKPRTLADNDASKPSLRDAVAQPSEPLGEPQPNKGKKAKIANEIVTHSGTSDVKEGKGGKKKKKAPDVDVVEPAVTPSASLTKVEMKQKRIAGAGEKKKSKIVKPVGTKSVKDKVLGRKVAQG